MKKEEPVKKIIYFDRETIRNILEEQNKGSKIKQMDITKSSGIDGEINAELKVKLGIPFLERIGFLFTGKIKTSLMIKKDNSTSITSTEISEFESIKDRFELIKHTIVSDIENSSTFFRVAGAFLKIMRKGVEDVDVKEFKEVMDGQDGYDTYKVSPQNYVRFNNTAFLSNYKRNDLLATRMSLYCIYIGKFEKDTFDFAKQIDKMQGLYTHDKNKTLADIYPGSDENTSDNNIKPLIKNTNETIFLYEVVYAYILSGELNDK